MPSRSTLHRRKQKEQDPEKYQEYLQIKREKGIKWRAEERRRWETEPHTRAQVEERNRKLEVKRERSRAAYYRRKAEATRQTQNSIKARGSASCRKKLKDMTLDELRTYNAMMRRKQRAALSHQKKRAIRVKETERKRQARLAKRCGKQKSVAKRKPSSSEQLQQVMINDLNVCKAEPTEVVEMTGAEFARSALNLLGLVAESRMAKRVLIGCTGSVASIKIPPLVNALRQSGFQMDIKVVSTQNALHFFSKDELDVPVLTDKDEWETWSSVQDPVLHIELRRWADVFLIAPLDANTLAKMANGLCDNLLTCVVRAWDPARPLLFAPAMNTFMWEHPLTARHIAALTDLGYREVPCVRKKLACGDIGYGAMAEVPTLVAAVEEALVAADMASVAS
ncbi:uncharacterized protein LOC101860265 [Aplysia californica]|uniref:Uncharacterized protein LOC101860265 n=1 Tax=Aplysia californica TaxID=6500 RepID=A0ABM1VWY9_APLCA|nr:uncharacterized protein LOC101860265 [Aplysia californica]XP_012940761.1 uncharacterized protein LOC101860265 [Aplysia californica]XP_012940762.1 uncharacterized protein LOC101860265 [Aplysia californica]XP_012940763.1 uncharacterized protein LOC101860265 [Aplysia californica]XP_035826930.1 uncharacterized protein LOC101860265 [Aplysia californica]XP_035826931.1 uncharacterized protein LOC101860265 [Aplysia californica]